MKSYIDKTSFELFEDIKASDQKAFKVLYNRLWDKLYTKACAILRDQNKAKDILQEVWIDIWQRRKEIENNNIEAYVVTAVKFKIYNTFRNTPKNDVLIDEFLDYINSNIVFSNPTEENILLEETRNHLEKSINNLPDKCQSVFKLSRYDNLKNKEIADKLNISQRTVETHISNALKILRSNLSIPTSAILAFLLKSIFFYV